MLSGHLAIKPCSITERVSKLLAGLTILEVFLTMQLNAQYQQKSLVIAP